MRDKVVCDKVACVCVTKLCACVTKLWETKLCAEAVADGESAQQKTRTPYNDAGKNHTQKCGLKYCTSSI